MALERKEDNNNSTLKQKKYFQLFDDDLIREIFKFLNKFELGFVRQVCQRFYHIVSDEFLQSLPMPTLDYTQLLENRCLAFDNVGLISGEKPSGNFFLTCKYINPFAGCDNKLMCSKTIPSHEDKPRGLYLYRVDLEGDSDVYRLKNFFVLIVYDKNNYEILAFSKYYKNTFDGPLQYFLHSIDWPENKDKIICLPERIIQKIVQQCNHIAPTVYQDKVYELWDAKNCQVIEANIFPEILDFQIPCFVIQSNENGYDWIQEFAGRLKNNLDGFMSDKSFFEIWEEFMKEQKKRTQTIICNTIYEIMNNVLGNDSSSVMQYHFLGKTNYDLMEMTSNEKVKKDLYACLIKKGESIKKYDFAMDRYEDIEQGEFKIKQYEVHNFHDELLSKKFGEFDIVPFAVTSDYIILAKVTDTKITDTLIIPGLYDGILFVWSIRKRKFLVAIDHEILLITANGCAATRKPVVCQGFKSQELFISSNYQRLIIFDGDVISLIYQDSVYVNASEENQTIGILKTKAGEVLCVNAQGKICKVDLKLKKAESFAQLITDNQIPEIINIMLLNNDDFACIYNDGYLRIFSGDNFECIKKIKIPDKVNMRSLQQQTVNDDILVFYEVDDSYVMLIIETISYCVKTQIKKPGSMGNVFVTCLGDVVMHMQKDNAHTVMNSLKFFRYAKLKPNPSVEQRHETEESSLLEQKDQSPKNLTM